MSKHQINSRETKVATPNGVGESVEHIVTIDDNAMPSPEELRKYKELDPNLVKYFMDLTSKEQANRHESNRTRFKIVSNTQRRNYRANMSGMVLAFLSLVLILALTGVAIYLDHMWFASIFTATSIVMILKTFVNAGKRDE